MDLHDIDSMAQSGHALSLVLMGCFYEHGYGRAQNLFRAAKCYRIAAQSGNSFGEFALARLYERPDYPGERNELLSKSLEHLVRASEAGLSAAKYRLAIIYFEGKRTSRDVDRAAQLLLEAGNAQYGPAWVALSNLYESTLSGKKKRTRQIECLKKGSELGYHRATFALGSLYEISGNSAEKSKAIQLYRLAASQGNKGALLKLGLIYRDENEGTTGSELADLFVDLGSPESDVP